MAWWLVVAMAVSVGGCMTVPIPETVDVELDAERTICITTTVKVQKRAVIIEHAPRAP